jgi:hypothetical protein
VACCGDSVWRGAGRLTKFALAQHALSGESLHDASHAARGILKLCVSLSPSLSRCISRSLLRFSHGLPGLFADVPIALALRVGTVATGAALGLAAWALLDVTWPYALMCGAACALAVDIAVSCVLHTCVCSTCAFSSSPPLYLSPLC